MNSKWIISCRSQVIDGCVLAPPPECPCKGGRCDPRTGECRCGDGLTGPQCDTCSDAHHVAVQEDHLMHCEGTHAHTHTHAHTNARMHARARAHIQTHRRMHAR